MRARTCVVGLLPAPLRRTEGGRRKEPRAYVKYGRLGERRDRDDDAYVGGAAAHVSKQKDGPSRGPVPRGR